MATPNELIRRAYDAFNERDLGKAIALMHPDVDWPNVFEGGRLRGREDVLAYWIRQFANVDARSEPRRITNLPDGRVAVEVHQILRDPHGTLLLDRRVVHTFEFDGELVVRMDVGEPD